MTINRFFQRKRFAEFQPLSMQEMAYPYEKQEQRDNQKDAIMLKAAELGLNLDAHSVDQPYAEELATGFNSRVEGLISNSSDMGVRDMFRSYAEIVRDKVNIEQTSAKQLAQRKGTIEGTYKYIQEADNLDDEERNYFLNDYRYKLEKSGAMGKLPGVDFTKSYDYLESKKAIEESVKDLKSSDLEGNGFMSAVGSANSYTDIWRNISKEGVSGNRILQNIAGMVGAREVVDENGEKSIRGVITNRELDASLNQRYITSGMAQLYEQSGGEEGMSLTDYKEIEASKLLQGALSHVTQNTDYNFNFVKDQATLMKIKADEEAANSVTIGSNASVQTLTSTAFGGETPSYEALETNRTNLVNSLLELEKELKQPNLDKSTIESLTSKISDTKDKLYLTNEMYNKVKPIFENNKDEKADELIANIKKLTTDSYSKTLSKAEQDNITRNVKNGLYTVQTVGNGYAAKLKILDSNGKEVTTIDYNIDLWKLSENDSEQRKIIKGELEKYTNISNTVFTASGTTLPGFTPGQNTTFWTKTLPQHISNPANYNNFTTMQNTRVVDEINELDPKSRDSIIESMNKLDASNVSISTHPSLSNDMMLSIKVPYLDKDNKWQSKDFQLSMNSNKITIGNFATDNYTKTPAWNYTAKINMIKASGLTGEGLKIPSLPNFTADISEKNEITGATIHGQKFTPSAAQEFMMKYLPLFQNEAIQQHYSTYIYTSLQEGKSLEDIYLDIYYNEKN